jgi:AcrR family transcriptional regulator
MYQGRGENGGRRAAHVEDTRRALLRTARRLFAQNGFQATRTEEIVQRAGLSRGALYHHFKDKEDLFRAVYDEVSAEVGATLWRRSDGAGDAWSRFRANSEVYLEAASTNQAYRQIVLIDGPAVLGSSNWSPHRGELDKMVEYLEEAVAEGVVQPVPVTALAQLLWFLGVGSAMYVAYAEDPERARHEINECQERLLGGLPAGSGRMDRSTGHTKVHESTEGNRTNGMGLLDRAGIPGEA